MHSRNTSADRTLRLCRGFSTRRWGFVRSRLDTPESNVSVALLETGMCRAGLAATCLFERFLSRLADSRQYQESSIRRSLRNQKAQIVATEPECHCYIHSQPKPCMKQLRRRSTSTTRPERWRRPTAPSKKWSSSAWLRIKSGFLP